MTPLGSVGTSDPWCYSGSHVPLAICLAPPLLLGIGNTFPLLSRVVGGWERPAGAGYFWLGTVTGFFPAVRGEAATGCLVKYCALNLYAGPKTVHAVYGERLSAPRTPWAPTLVDT